jgi:hypothetical protein
MFIQIYSYFVLSFSYFNEFYMFKFVLIGLRVQTLHTQWLKPFCGCTVLTLDGPRISDYTVKTTDNIT